MRTLVSPAVVAASLLFGLSPARALERYDIDPVHSSVSFKVKHLFSYVKGTFDEVHGTVTGDSAKPEDAKVEVEIKTASVDTHDQKRDDHLRSNAFFDAEQYPTITFKSKKVNTTGQDTAFVVGDLTMHGVTKEIIMDMKFLGKGKGLEGRMHTGWEGKTALKRSDFGLTWSKAVEGTQVVGDDIEIALEVDAVEPDPAALTAEAKALLAPPAAPPAATSAVVTTPPVAVAPPAPDSTLTPIAEPPPQVPATLSPPPPAPPVEAAPPLPPGAPAPVAPPPPAPPTAEPPATPSPVPPAPPTTAPPAPAPLPPPAAPEPPTPPTPPAPPIPPAPAAPPIPALPPTPATPPAPPTPQSQ